MIEILVSSAVLALLLALLATAIGSALTTVQRAHAKIDQFAAARQGFEQLVAALSQSTLNTYWDYDVPANPGKYLRKSDLHFLVEQGAVAGQSVFFQAPLSRAPGVSATGILNAVGFWVDFGDDDAWRPGHVATSRSRYRLMQGIQPAGKLEVFNNDTDAAWADAVVAVPDVGFPVAANVLALILWPRLPTAQDAVGTELTTDYLYDSRDGTDIQKAQLPPAVHATMIVIDEMSAARIESGATEPASIKDALAGRFRDVTKYQEDLDAVKAALDAARVGYLVLSSPVTLRESKWSSQ